MPICHDKLQLQTGKQVFASGNVENKFFKMLHMLLKRCSDNINMAKGEMKDRLYKYKVMVSKDQGVVMKIEQMLKMIDNFDE